MKKEINPVLDKVIQLSGITPLENESSEETILRGIEIMASELKAERSFCEFNMERISSMVNTVVSFAKLDYSPKIKLTEKADHIDALASGINMLGEELRGSTISLHEKEVLLKEIHHRVKNNLQIISSLLNLQSDQIDDESFKEKYQVSRDRIRSMALVHEKLYESENLSMIDFSDYVNSLTNSLNQSYNPDNSRIEMNIEVGEGKGLFKIETAIPCGLILNELLSNSFKYAFPNEKKGKVGIYFGCIKEKGKDPYYKLEVKDDGVGIPDSIEILTAETLGFQLVTMLTDQLNGKLVLDRKNGTNFSLCFTEGK